MKKAIVILMAALLVMGIVGCSKKDAADEFEDMTGQDQYADIDADYGDMEPNEDGLDDVGNETAGVDDKDGNGEDIVDDSDNAQITVGGATWPQSAPAQVPELQAGEIAGTAVTDRGAVVSYTGVDREKANEYAENLENAGWQKLSESVDSDYLQVFFQKDGLYLDIEWDLGDCYITWTQD